MNTKIIIDSYEGLIIPVLFQETEYGECGSNWLPEGYLKLESISGIIFNHGDELIVCCEGVYSHYLYILF